MEEDIRHFVLETKELGTFDVVEYKEYQKLRNRIDKAIEYIENNSRQSELNIYGIPKCLIFKGSVENLLETLKGEDKE